MPGSTSRNQPASTEGRQSHHWRLNPWADDPRRSLAAVGAALVFGAIVLWASDQWLWAVLGASLFLAAQWSSLLPTDYEIDERGLARTTLGRRVFLPWRQVRGYQRHGNELLLFTRTDSAWAAYLGAWRVCCGAQADRVAAMIDQFIARAGAMPSSRRRIATAAPPAPARGNHTSAQPAPLPTAPGAAPSPNESRRIVEPGELSAGPCDEPSDGSIAAPNTASNTEPVAGAQQPQVLMQTSIDATPPRERLPPDAAPDAAAAKEGPSPGDGGQTPTSGPLAAQPDGQTEQNVPLRAGSSPDRPDDATQTFVPRVLIEPDDGETPTA